MARHELVPPPVKSKPPRNPEGGGERDRVEVGGQMLKWRIYATHKFTAILGKILLVRITGLFWTDDV